MRHVALNMAMDFFHPSFGPCDLGSCWKRTLEEDSELFRADTLPLLERLPLLECLYLDFSSLNLKDQTLRDVISQ